jgi:thiosulfate/3-mercaptopyruvate sulfurtransferase
MRTTLVSTEELVEHPQWRVFDCRHDLANPDLGEQQYRQAHVPGAAFAHLDRDLSAVKSGSNGRHPLPERAVFVGWLGRQGVKPDDQVVCYDGANGVMASRLWWMLRWVGHAAVAVLDGGFAKWTAEGRPTTTTVPRHASVPYPADRSALAQAVPVAMVERELQRLFLLDARTPVRYRGEQEPIDPVAGHIPGAHNRSSGDNVTAQGTFKPAAQLRREFQSILGNQTAAEVVHYCGSGVSACHNLLALEVAGLPGGQLYPGSWSEWSADPKRPIAR